MKINKIKIKWYLSNLWEMPYSWIRGIRTVKNNSPQMDQYTQCKIPLIVFFNETWQADFKFS